MTTNPQDANPKSNTTQPAPGPLFAGGLFGNNANTTPSLFGNTKGPSMFTNPTPPSTNLFGSIGQGGASSLFPSANPTPPVQPATKIDHQIPSLFGGFTTTTPNQPLFQNSSFGGQKLDGASDKNLPITTTGSGGVSLFGGATTKMMFGQKDDKKQETQPQTKKQSNPPNSLFSSGTPSLFGNKQQTNSLFSTSKQSVATQKKEETKHQTTNAIGSLFGNTISNASAELKETLAPKKPQHSLFGANLSTSTLPNPNTKNEKASVVGKPEESNKVQNSAEEKKISGSLFGNNNTGGLFTGGATTSTGLFGPVPTATPQEATKPNAASTSLFGSSSSAPNKPLQPLFGPPATQTPQQPLLGASSMPLKTPSFGEPTTQPLQAQAPKVKQANKSEKTLIKQASNPNIPLSQTLNTSTQPIPKSNALPMFTRTQIPAPAQSKKETPFMGNFHKQKVETPNKPEASGKSQSFKLFTNEKQNNTQSDAPKVSVRSNGSQNSSILTSKLTENKQGQSTKHTNMTNNMTETTENKKVFTFLKPRQINLAGILDFKMIKQQERSEMFSTFMSKQMKKILISIKMYFTTRTQSYKPLQHNDNNSQKQKFLIDLTNLLVKNMGLSEQSWGLVNQFLKRVFVQQRYQNALFRQTHLNVQYFTKNQIYSIDFNQNYYLNEMNSKQLQLLVQKIVNKWNIERINLLNFLFNYSDLFQKPSDLFFYLFKYILQSQRKNIQTSNVNYKIFLNDFEIIIKKKLIEVIAYYNTRLKDFKIINVQQAKILIKLTEFNRDESVNELSLKILLNSINFKQPKQVSSEIFEAIKQTKSFALMPLRAILHRLNTKRHQFVPSPKDLYKYIKGDEWIDWFDIYLSDPGKQGLQLQVGQPQSILNSLCTISGHLLLERMLSSKKGILKFFNLLRDQNMVNLYYKLLEACIFDDRSISQIDEFYFKKMHFNLEYQQIIEYIIHFNQSQKHANEENILAILQVKISLLVKILQISPEKLIQLERYLFYHDYGKYKKFKNNQPVELGTRGEGQKIIHFFLDVINIISIKNISNKILSKIFKVLTYLLKNKQTEKIVLNSLKINRPSFNFMQNTLHPYTLNSINGFLEQIISGNYLYDLIFSYSQCKDQQKRMELFYPFRYKDAEFNNLLRYQKIQENDQQPSFSIYWMNQIIKIINLQRFNPSIINQILQKFYIIPYNASNQSFNHQKAPTIYKKSKQFDNKIPTIFQNIISNLNQLTIWQDIQRILQVKITKRQGKLDIINKFIYSNGQRDNYRYILSSLKLMRTIFRLSDLLTQYEEVSSNHFIVKTLSAINFLNKSKINSQFSSHASKNNIILSIIANFQLQQEYFNDLSRIPWEAQQNQGGEIIYQALIVYINKNKKNIDFQQVNNYFKRPNNEHYESQNSIISISLDLFIEIIKLSPQCSIQYTLTVFLNLKQQEKLELKSQILNKFMNIITNYIQDQRIGCRIMQFIYNLKYNCGKNKLHASLSSKLFAQFLNANKRTQKTCKFNVILCKYLLKQLEQNNFNYESFTEQLIQGIIQNFKFKDSFLNNYYEFKDTKQIGKMIKNYHNREYGFFNLNQLQRIIQQRAIINIGIQFQYLRSIVEIIMIQILKRKHSQSLINCIYLFNTLLLNHNMILLEKDLPNQYKSRTISNFHYNTNQPRLYIRDPVELYIVEARDTLKKHDVQINQKNNIVEWLLDRCQLLSNQITTYIKFILTIDKYLYSNNPISYTFERNDINHIELFSHLALGKMNFTATQLFGKSNSDSIDAVQGIASNLINRLIQIRKLSQYGNYNEVSYREGLKILGFCLQWLRGREKYGENASHSIIRKIQKNYHFLLPQDSLFLSGQSIKVLISALSIGQNYFSSESKDHIHEAVYCLIERYWVIMQKGFIEEQAQSFGELVQQAISILIIIPPNKNQVDIFELIVKIWIKQKNYQYFFNQSRLILSLTTLYPEEIVKLQPLTKCEIIATLSNFYSRYEDSQRKFDGIAWTWVVKIATQLVNHPLSVLVISQVSQFFKKYKERFIYLFELSDKLSKSYLDDLQAALQLLICLYSHDLWINFNRPLAQELTYLLSHKLIKIFIGYAQGKISFLIGSNNDKNLSMIKCSSTIQEQFAQNFDIMTQQNIFVTEMKIKINHCIRNYCILMKKAFKSSHFVQKYFENTIYENFKYFSSFWDIFNKNMITLFSFSCKQFKIWNSIKNLKDTLITLHECNNAPHTFVENGYLSSIIDLPKNEYELFSDIYLLNYLATELAGIHYLKEKLYVNKFNNLLSSHIQSFGKKIKEHIDNVKIEKKKVNGPMNQYINEEQFINISEIIDCSKVGRL